jgi:hypothetical protein
MDMREDVQAAIESARSICISEPGIHRAEPQRRRSFDSVRALVLAVVQELPPEMTVLELIDELHIGSTQ